ncbi:hypothetical protein BH23ACT9_BH23ACT9_08740 [soil metagenome]
MTTYRDQLLDVVATAEERMGTLHDRHADASAPRGGSVEFIALGTALILRAEARAVALADLALALEVSRQTRTAVPPLGLGLSAADTQATRKAMETLTTRLTETDNPRARAVRLARGRTTQTGGKYYDVGMAEHPQVVGWTRGTSPSACELCGWLERDGFVFSADTPMYRHPGCTCVPIPTVRS